MTRPRYMPIADALFLIWFENFVAKFLLNAAALNLSGETASATADLNYIRYVINNTESQRNRTSDNIAVKNQLLNGPTATAVLLYPGPAALTGLIPPAAGAPPGAPPGSPSNPPPAVPPGVIPRTAAPVERILAAVGYVEGMGHDMDILAPAAAAVDLNALKPQIEVSQRALKVLIEWTKARGTDALRIEADYGTGTFVHVIDDPRPDHLDAHPLPAPGQSAVWKYRAIYVRDGVPVGSYSDVSSITVTGN